MERAGTAVNIAHECMDRHIAEGRGDDPAFRFLGASDDPVDPGEVFTYHRLAVETSRFAAGLGRLGVRYGDRVAVIGGRSAHTYLALLGCFRGGFVACPLFSAFGPEPIRARLDLAGVTVVVTSRAIHDRHIAPMRADVGARLCVLTDVDDDADAPEGTIPWSGIVGPHDPTILPTAPTTRASPALIHFTSGTTGTPKGALHVHGAVASHRSTSEEVLGLRSGDVFWCTADPGWITGTSYGIVGPLTIGATVVVDEAEFDPARWYRILEAQRVQVWYSSPTAFRMLMRAGDAPRAGCDLTGLREIFSVGEPLAADAVDWAERVIGRTIHDTWWQTETGSIGIGRPTGERVEPGSMGRVVGGLDVRLLATDEAGDPVLDDDGHVVEVDDPERSGMIAIHPGWPSMFRTYVGAPERYAAAFVDGWYVSGDLARRSQDGSFWFIGRADDVIKTAGHLVGPFEVEQVLDEHADVVSSGVYGVPDPIAGEVVHACVMLRDGADVGPDTVNGIMAHCRRRLGAAIAPRTITVVSDLPVTHSGKIMRRILRARELGLPEVEVSALEGSGRHVRVPA